MKQIKHLWLACLCILLTASQCKKDPLSKLPPETQTGANTFGCLVNGEAWVPSGTDGYSGQNIKANYGLYYPSSEGYSFVVSAINKDGSPRSSIVLGIDSLKISEGMRLPLKLSRRGVAAANYIISLEQNIFMTADSLKGELYFKKLDENSQIASGTFRFDAINANGDKVHVTEGRFDVKYTR